MDITLIISITAITVSVIDLVFVIESNSKKIQIRSYKSKSKKGYFCEITLTNIGKKTIYLRSISIEEVHNEKIKRKPMDYNYYKDKIENKPLNPEEWRTFVFYEDEYLKVFDTENNTYRKTRLLVKDSKGKTYKSKWFRQST